MQHGSITVEGAEYQIGSLSARTQFHIVRRLTPLIGVLLPRLAIFKDWEKRSEEEQIGVLVGLFPSVAPAFTSLSDADCDFIIDACLAVAKFRMPTGYFDLVSPTGGMMNSALTMRATMQITWHTLARNLNSFFPSGEPRESGTTPQVG